MTLQIISMAIEP